MMIVNIPSEDTGRESFALSAKNSVTPITSMARRDIGVMTIGCGEVLYTTGRRRTDLG